MTTTEDLSMSIHEMKRFHKFIHISFFFCSYKFYIRNKSGQDGAQIKIYKYLWGWKAISSGNELTMELIGMLGNEDNLNCFNNGITPPPPRHVNHWSGEVSFSTAIHMALGSDRIWRRCEKFAQSHKDLKESEPSMPQHLSWKQLIVPLNICQLIGWSLDRTMVN